MFETAEVGRRVSGKEYGEREPKLREALLLAQDRWQDAPAPALVLLSGLDGVGKGETLNQLFGWLDPRWLWVRPFDRPTQEERERPRYWRYWRALPPRGRIAILHSAWYREPIVRRAEGGNAADFETQLDEILDFERTLTDDGALVLKLWIHLGKKAHRRRLERLEADPLQSWRVSEELWQHWRRHDRFAEAGELAVTRTHTAAAPWHVVEAGDARYRSLRVGELLLEALERRRAELAARPEAEPDPDGPIARLDATGAAAQPTLLSKLDLSLSLPKKRYREQKGRLQGRIHRAHRRVRERGVPAVLVLEGWDAAGKGGAIRRLTPALDARTVQVIPVGAPSDEERARHWLWRFWRRLPRDGRTTVFDRSWYGRVLVERVEGHAREEEWRRAYAEIDRFERQLVEHGTVLVKCWLHISPEEQARRFRERQRIPYKRYKLTAEDWRNRSRWAAYERAAHEMIGRTGTAWAPWTLVAAEDKRHARVEVLRAFCRALEEAVR